MEKWQKQKQYLYVVNVEMNHQKWLGKCPACNSWNTFYEQKIEKYTEENKIEKKINNTPKPLNTYIGQEANRTSTGYSELDRVLGGG